MLYNIKVVKKIFSSLEFILLLVVAGLILVLILFFIRKEKSQEIPIIVDLPEEYCGITVISPDPGSRVELPLQITGYIGGCGWEEYLGYVARMRVYDEELNPVSRIFLVESSGSKSPVSSQFKFTLDTLFSDSKSLNLIFESFGSAPDYSVPIKL